MVSRVFYAGERRTIRKIRKMFLGRRVGVYIFKLLVFWLIEGTPSCSRPAQLKGRP